MRHKDRETWWWNWEVRAKKLASEVTEKKHKQYREKNRLKKSMVENVKDRAWKAWSEALQSYEGKAKIFKIAKQIRKERKDIVGSKYKGFYLPLLI